jgi:hypothetical protein
MKKKMSKLTTLVTYYNFINYFLCNRTRNEHFAYLKQAAKSNFATVVFYDVVNVILKYSDIFTIIYKIFALFMPFP